MWAYVICAAIWVGFMLHWAISSIPRHRFFEIYAGCGIGICLTLLVLGLFGWYRPRGAVLIPQILQVAGSIFYLAAILLTIISFADLGRRGRPEGFIEHTTVLIERGTYRVIRHPLYFGLALWSIGLMLLIQLISSAILGMIALFCFWMASKKEDEYNIKKFGDNYRDYMNKIPMWNVVKGPRRRF